MSNRTFKPRSIRMKPIHKKTDMHADKMQTEAVAASGEATSNGIGYRGAYTGNLQHHEGYAEHYHEAMETHSRKVFNYDVFWTFNATIKEVLNYSKWVGGGVKYPAITEENPWNIYFPRAQNFDYTTLPGFSDIIACQPINTKFSNFIDNKMFSIMKNYTKFQLKSFTVEMTTRTFLYNYANLSIDNQILVDLNLFPWPLSFPNQGSREIDMDYWVIRDAYNDYGEQTDRDGNIKIHSAINNDVTNTDILVKDIRNYDDYLGVMSNKEKFSFTREVNSKGSYYMTLQTLDQLQNSTVNISQIVAELEGANTGGTFTQPLPEGFNVTQRQ